MTGAGVVQRQARQTAEPLIAPLDEHNRALLANVHPEPYENPVPRERYNLVVLGAGTAGLITAAAAAGRRRSDDSGCRD